MIDWQSLGFNAAIDSALILLAWFMCLPINLRVLVLVIYSLAFIFMK